jgi:PAS domain-containing protein
MKRVTLPLLAVWVALLLSAGVGLTLLAMYRVRAGIAAGPIPLLIVVFAASTLYLSVRMLFFRQRLTAFLRHLLAGDYQAGIREIGWFRDEVLEISRLANRAAERLAAYDRLRAERTGLSYRALEQVFKTVDDPLMLVDVEKLTARVNPALQRMCGVQQHVYDYRSIEMQPENNRLRRLLLVVALRDRLPTEGNAMLKLPPNGTAAPVMLRFVPLKGDDERVRLVVVFVSRQPREADGER